MSSHKFIYFAKNNNKYIIFMNQIGEIELLGDKITYELSQNNKLHNLKYLLEQYTGNDWIDFVKINKNIYNRTLVYKNDFIEILILTWNTNQSSKIHDHPDCGCLLKVLQGELTEFIYIKQDNNLVQTKETVLTKNMICYQIGKNGLHKIKNTEINGHIAVSIHVYSPSGYIPNNYNE
jgi:cysteine dioxygenase